MSVKSSSSSGRAIKLVRWLLWMFGMKSTVRLLCDAKTLNEQRELWSRVRRILLSRTLHWLLIGGNFLWKAAGVPPAQRAMIVSDHLDQEGLNPLRVQLHDNSGEAIWEYIENTLEPVARESLISEDNFYYFLTLQGKYSRRHVSISMKVEYALIIKQVPSTICISERSRQTFPHWCV